MKLFYTPGACSLSPHIVLIETQLPFSLERVDLSTHQTSNGIDFYSINPKGYVPVLELIDGESLTKGPVIAQYISERANRHDLLPPAPELARYQVLEWQSYISTELHKSFSPLFNPTLSDQTKEFFSSSLIRKFQWVSDQLKGKEYLNGDIFTIADAYLFVITRWAPMMKIDLSKCTQLNDYMKRLIEHPSVREALHAEGLSK